MEIAIIANDKKKELITEFCIAYCGVLAKHNLCATATTGKYISEATVEKLALEAKFIINPYTPVSLMVKNSMKETSKEAITPVMGPYINDASVITASLASKVRKPTLKWKMKVHI